jgi:hypothetical protein
MKCQACGPHAARPRRMAVGVGPLLRYALEPYFVYYAIR